MNTDKYGVLGQIQDGGWIEGGDSAKWQGDWCYLTNNRFWSDCNNEHRSYVDFFEKQPGRYVRHPDPDQTFNGFGADIRAISRDQMTGIIAGIINEGNHRAMGRLMWQHAKRGFLFSWNTIHNGVDPEKAKWKLPDLTGPEILAAELRGFGKWSWVFWPILCVLDLHMLANTLFINRVPVEKDNECISYLIKLFISNDHVPTPVSRLSLMLVDKSLMWQKLKSYWCGWRKQDDMAQLYFFWFYK